jgi:cytochrome P450
MAGLLSRLIGGDLATLARDPPGEFCRRSSQGAVVPLKIGFHRGHLVSDPALIRHVLLDNIGNYDKHTPAFHGESVKRFGPIISRMAAECATDWEAAARRGDTVDACTDMMRVTLRAVAETLFDDLATCSRPRGVSAGAVRAGPRRANSPICPLAPSPVSAWARASP